MSSGSAREGRAPSAALRGRLTRLMAARLGLSLGVFALALALVGAGHEGAEAAERGLYGTLAFSFLATAVYGLSMRFVERLGRFAALQLATDLAIVTSLVFFSGGVDSIFSFLYLPITVTGAILFHRGGAYASAGLASLGYGAALLATGPLGLATGGRPAPPGEVALAAWGVHTGALLMVALLSSELARELRVAGERLDARTQDLALLQRLHERTVESLTSGLLTLDGEGRITSFNPEAERITGREAREVAGRRLEDVLPGASALTTDPAPPRGTRARRRLAFSPRPGVERFLGLSSSILRNEDGHPAGHVVIFQDVTEVVAMERDLRRNERLAGVGQLAADIAHEIRNPLAAISGSVEMLQGGGGEEAEQERRRLMGIVLREIDRLNALITDFLQYARPAPPKPEAVALRAAVDELLEMARGRPERGVRVDVAIEPSLRVRADGTQLRQVLWNLLTNAEQAMPGGGEICIAAEPVARAAQGAAGADRNEAVGEPRGVEIRVSDTGTGIAPEDLERIFDPFFTTKTGGTGLGLATVHRIVEGNGGSLQVASQVGRGTEFRIRLPRAEEER